MQSKRIELKSHVDSLLVMSDLHSFIEPLQVLDGKLASCPRSVQVIVAGDILSGGANPIETVEWVRRHAGEFAVLGNHDEASLREEEGDHPPYTEAGAHQRLDQQQIEYMQALPCILELTWKGTLIRVMHGHRTSSGESVSWMAKPSEMLTRFADPAVAITVVGHTHYPFVAEQDGCRVANCGSTSGLLLGLQHQDGSISPWGDDAAFKAPSEIYSTFLSIIFERGELQTTIEHFDYDRAKAIRRLREEGDPNVENRKLWLETGVVCA